MALLPTLLFACLMGFIIGCMFFIILWISAQKVITSEHPITWFVCTWFARMSLAPIGFYWVANGNWQLLLSCLFGFILGRWFVSKTFVNRYMALKAPAKFEAGVKHAS